MLDSSRMPCVSFAEKMRRVPIALTDFESFPLFLDSSGKIGSIFNSVGASSLAQSDKQ